MVNVENVVNVGMWKMWLMWECGNVVNVVNVGMWSMCAVAVEGAKVARNDTFLVALMPSRIVIFWVRIPLRNMGVFLCLL
ncbi:MAG: hypothetical protein Q7U74_12095 [Saprospiraceae bacterium]|nr:hypothetical protein [Saprospiraceae bacterium]